MAGFGCSGEQFIEGQVIDYETREPVAGVRDILQQSAAVFFVRNQDGHHHAKFFFNPRTYGTEGSERDYEKGNWALMLEYVYNPDPSRNLPFEKTY